MEKKVVDQREYLRRYLSSGDGEDRKKRKKKKAKVGAKTVKIIDDDIDLKNMRPIQDNEFDIFIDTEDAPQIAGIVDERGPVDFSDKRRWRIIADDQDGDITFARNDRDRGYYGDRNTRTENYGDDLSPPRNRRLNSDDDLSPPRMSKIAEVKHKKRKSTKHVRNDSDVDLSPPRRKKSKRSLDRDTCANDDSEDDLHLHRHKKKKKKKKKKASDSDLSPPRCSQENDLDLSPPRQDQNCDSDVSLPRKSTKHGNVDLEQNRYPDTSTSVQRKKSGDYPRGSRNNSDSDLSPPRQPTSNNKYDSDTSPPRRSKKEHYTDHSPSRRDKKHRNAYGNDNFDYSLSRHSEESHRASYKSSKKYRHSDKREPTRDSHFPDKIREHAKDSRHSYRRDKEGRRDEHHSRRHGESDFSRRREKSSRWDDNSRHESRPAETLDHDGRMKKTLDGKTAGLQDARALREETEAHKKREAEQFSKLSKDVSGVGRAAILRDSKTGKKRDLEAEAADEREKQKRQDELNEKYAKWGKGLKQVEDRAEKIKDDLYEMSKPLARYADDVDLDKHLREQEREGDPMLDYIKQKQIKEGKRQPDRPRYEGSFMPNRFGVKPGHRWDGVDRSNGYEKKWFEAQNAKIARQEEAYKWSTADM
ncbi:hypothetical protein KM043_006022 [Ampulex compressa]|nr:hypothetical protein KM043_006022 [Ampulex compressa]